jgi:hypothetical protein
MFLNCIQSSINYYKTRQKRITINIEIESYKSKPYKHLINYFSKWVFDIIYNVYYNVHFFSQYIKILS